MEFSHVSVLLFEAVGSLNIKKDGVYVDCTAGGGGHSAEILKRLENGRLFALDRDPEAIAALKERFKGDERVTVVQTEFENIRSVLATYGEEHADGVLADLGVSSHQLDTAERGFSFHSDAPLDMRMSKQGVSAADLVNTLSERELERIIRTNGEEKFSRSIARAIVRERQKKPVETTLELVDIIKSAMPEAAKRNPGHPARRTFQALRIEVNGELDRLESSLEEMFSSLCVGGRLSVITFHSLEDRIVKRKFASLCTGCTCPPSFPVCVCGKTPRGKLAFKSVLPGEQELEANPRSRSARLRSIEKLK
ncbi:MAG: 16S rRNA (cytosine(1402)-N(4))-methyltransferase RsmH [Clostridiaceae bacterium]|nr:16S rRNA (cytosine(1402)-N(4))-methyltransferase RsmH [Clostridiaceae bacterium]MDY5991123.1 16S rRNA (cytosine(1402)-N(4))-methyltransferase RsmH [Oscillospiraceae bacterium]